MNRRLLAILLALSLLLTAVPAALAEEAPAAVIEAAVPEATGETGVPGLEAVPEEEQALTLEAEETPEEITAAPEEVGMALDDQEAEGEPVLAAASALPDKVAFGSAKLNIGLKETRPLVVVLGSDPDVEYVRDLTFTSSKPKYVEVDEDGFVTGVKKGSSTITVTTSNGRTATCKVTVKSAPSKVTVTPKTVKLNAGDTAALTAKLNSSSAASAITWHSTDEDVATVDPDTGLVTAVDSGVTTVTAVTFNGKTATIPVTVLAEPTSLDFDEHDIVMGVKQTITLDAKLNPGAECPITYSVDNARVLKLKGKTLTAQAAGTATVTASIYNGLEDSMTVTVEPAPKSVKLPFKTMYIGVGDTFQLDPVVDGCRAGLTFTSSKTKYATVTEEGLITAEQAGTAYVTIKTYNKKSFKLKVIVQKAPTSLTVTPEVLDMSEGETEKLNCKVPAGSFASITLTTSDPGVVTVDNETGELHAVGMGSAVVTATTYNGLEKSCVVNVKPAPRVIELEEYALDLAVKDTAQLVASFPDGGYSRLTYVSSDTKVATVSATGLVTGKKAGVATIKVMTSLPEVYAVAEVQVWGAPTRVSLPASSVELGVDDTYDILPIIPDNTRTTFTYRSSSTKIATVDAFGTVTAHAKGTATITVTTHNGKTAKLTVNVVNPFYPDRVTLSGEVPKLLPGETCYIEYDVYPSSARSFITMNWSTSNKRVATVDDDGEITAVGKGTATITGVAEENPKCKLTVKVTVVSSSYVDLATEEPAWTTDIYDIDANMELIYAIRESAYNEIDRLVDEDEISSSDARIRKQIIENIFDCYAFPWMTLKLQKYWKSANSEGGVKDFKPGIVYYGLPYNSSSSNRDYNVAKALDENRYYDSGDGYYILNQNRLVSGKYVGNDCSGLVSVAIWGTNNKHSDDRTTEILKTSDYRTISGYSTMRPGDLLCYHDSSSNAHVVMFLYYVDDDKTQFMLIENGGDIPGTNTVHARIHDVSYYIGKGYKVRRLAKLG